MKFEYFSDILGEWRWMLRGNNGARIASGEGYKYLEDCLHGINLVKASFDAKIEARGLTLGDLPQPPPALPRTDNDLARLLINNPPSRRNGRPDGKIDGGKG
jgi:uncharacterized protein